MKAKNHLNLALEKGEFVMSFDLFKTILNRKCKKRTIRKIYLNSTVK